MGSAEEDRRTNCVLITNKMSFKYMRWNVLCVLLPTRNNQTTTEDLQRIHDQSNTTAETTQRGVARWGPYNTRARVGYGRDSDWISEPAERAPLRVGVETPQKRHWPNVRDVEIDDARGARECTVVLPILPAVSVRANYHPFNQDNVWAATEGGRTALILLDGHGSLSEQLTHELLPEKLSVLLLAPENIVQTLRNIDASLASWVWAGSTLTGVVVDGCTLHVVNLGDSRTVVVDASGHVIFATEEHQPTNQRESARITEAGGFVQNGRIGGSIAVSRALGDHIYKETTPPLMSSDAEVTEIKITSPVFAVVMSDGMWVSANFEDVLREISHVAKGMPINPTPEKLSETAAHLVDLFADGLDDCTAAIAYIIPAGE